MRSLLFVLTCGLQMGASAQELFFRHLSTADGFSDNAMTALHQDRDGFLWVGTQHGLNRYDGRHVRTWHADDGLGGEHIVSIIAGREGALWVGMREGSVARLSPGSDRFTPFRPTMPGPGTGFPITCLFDLNDTTLMVGAERIPIAFMDKRTGNFTYWDGEGPIAPRSASATPKETSNWCHHITAIGDDRLAIGFLLGHDQRVVDRHTGSGIAKAFHMHHPGDQSITDAIFHRGSLYGVGWQRQVHVTDTTGHDHIWPVPDECTSITPLDSLHLLIGTRDHGLLRMHTTTGAIEQFSHDRREHRSLSDDRMSTVLVDREGRIWVGTSNGLNMHDPKAQWTSRIPFHTHTASEIRAMGMHAAQDGRLFICTGSGLFVHEKSGAIRHHALRKSSTPVQVNCIVPHGKEWIVGCEHGVFRWDGRTDEVSELRSTWVFPGPDSANAPVALPSLFQVRSVLHDTTNGRDRLLLGVLGYGLTVLDLDQGTAHYLLRRPGHPNTIGNNLVRKLARSMSGTVWAATKEGLYRWHPAPDGNEDRFIPISGDGLSAAGILDVLPEGDGRAWFTTRNMGLVHWNGTRTSIVDRTTTGAISGLVHDRNGRVWCAREGGLDMLDTTIGTWERHDLHEDGIAHTPAALTALPDGRIAFVHDDQLHFFDPDRIRAERAAPLPYLTGLTLANTPIMHRLREGTLSLASNEQLLTITVSALDLSQGDGLRFAIMLDGIDRSPQITSDGIITYASLPSGTFRLMAYTVAGNGRYSQPVVIATIVKAVPVWQRWWFFLLVAGLVGAVVFSITRYRYRQKLALQAVRVRIAGDLHDEVGSSLSSITIGSQLAQRLGSGENEQVHKLLQRIGETSSDSLRSISDIVWAIDPKNDQGDALVQRMRRVAMELLGSKGIDVVFNVGPGVEDLKLAMETRKELLLIFKEAVHNASKYSEAKHVRVDLFRDGGTLMLIVKDDGRGFDPALHGDGHGLGSMRRRAAGMGARALIESRPGKGATVTLGIPLTRNRGSQ